MRASIAARGQDEYGPRQRPTGKAADALAIGIDNNAGPALAIVSVNARSQMPMTTATPPTDMSPPPVADAPRDNWVDAHAPESWRPYLRLARADRPIGTWLLLFPCWWSLCLASIASGRPYPNPWHLLLFAIGAFAMRAAGCAYNDFIDRDYDAMVARTMSRPIPSGQISPRNALIFVALLGLVGLVVLLQFNTFTIWLAIASLALVLVYPFMKRLTNWPQLVLGLAFNWGALVGWSALMQSLALPALALYAGCVLWTLGYDTIYAHQDKEDDLMLGLKSTALHFGPATATWVGGFYLGALVLWGLACLVAGAHLVTFVALVVVGLHFAWQVSGLDIDDAGNCLLRFRANRNVGYMLFAGLLADMAISWASGVA